MSMTSRTALLSLVSLLLITAAALAQPATGTDGAGAPPDPRKAIGIEKIDVAQRLGANRHALIIGINDYADARIPDLRFAEADARLLFDTLTHAQIGGFKKDNVTLLTGKQASAREVRKALSALRGVGEDDLVIVFFSGHGAKQRGETCWVTQDAEIEFLADTALTNDQLKKYLDAIPSKRLVTFIDACYAADTVINQKSIVDVGDVTKSFTGAGRVTIASAGGGQESIEAEDLKQGIFTYYLVQGLKGAADSNGDGVQTLDEVWAHLNGSVAQEARKRQGIQVPTKHSLAETQSDKFLLTIDAARLQRNLRETAEVKALREKRLQTLANLYLDEKLTLEQTQLGQQLLGADPSKLDENDRKRLAFYTQVLDGELAPDRLARAMDLIETPAQRQARQAREAQMRAEFERTTKIADLWKTAQANDNKTTGKAALAALDDLLKLDPNHAEAKKLRDKIAGYFGPPTLDLGNNIKLELVKIEPGEFEMGSEITAAEVARRFNSKAEYFEDEHPRHKVTIARGFHLGKFEVTRGQFRQFVTDTGYRTDAEKDGKGGMGWTGSEFKQSTDYSWRDAGFRQDDDHPVVNVSWNDAVAFCAWLSKKSGGKVRLPTEAEWEYAARGGKQGLFPWGDDPDDGAGWGNAGDQTLKGQFETATTFSWRDGYVFTAPVGRFKTNAFGLHDMLGNVWEWTNSKHESYPYRSTDGREEPGGTASRVLRGGSWYYNPVYCRSAFRDGGAPVYRFYNVGFRVVLDF